MADPGPVVFLMGPTGAGKTRVALALAQRFPLEIVSVDSALVYRGLDIGSAKPNPFERRQVAHHLIDICEPSETYSAARFRDDALGAIDAIRARGRVPLLVGGTGLYFRALAEGLAPLPEADPDTRAQLQQRLARDGAAVLYAELATVDPQAAARIHPNDPQRLLRALEVHALTGKPLSVWWQERPLSPLAGSVRRCVLAPVDRHTLHEAIAGRLQTMLERGFVNEVRRLRARSDVDPAAPALRAVGYREVWRYLDGELDYAAMRERAIIATRQLAKRQLTWLRREPDCRWFDCDARDLSTQVLDALGAEIAGAA